MHALKIPDQSSCPMELKNTYFQYWALSLTMVHEEVSLTCSLRIVWAHSTGTHHNKIIQLIHHSYDNSFFVEKRYY